MAEPAPASAPQPATAAPLVRAEDVVKHFPARLGASVKAVDGVSFEIRRGECLGLVGESGCGKSTLGRLVTQLLPLTSGRVWFKDVDLSRLRGEKLRRQRRDFQMIFQDPYASLDPRMTVGDIIAEPLDNFRVARGRVRNERVQELLHTVGLNPNFNNRYPHEFSGGQRQRIGIARALVVRPKFIVADEPVSALDVSIQAQVVNLLQDLQQQLGLTYLFIAHDLSVVRHISDRVAVMYVGKVMELAGRDALYEKPLHPYTQSLLSAIPIPDPRAEARRERIILEGDIPSPVRPPSGCRFHTRCPIAYERCRVEVPELLNYGDHFVACHKVQELGGAQPAVKGGAKASAGTKA